MARKEETPNIVERFAEFKELKNIDKTTMISVLEESFRSVLKGMLGTDENLDVIMNPDKGDVQIFQNLEVVPDGAVTSPNLQISLSDARAEDDPDVEIGEEHTREIIFTKFGRRAILNLRQTLQTKILDLQKEAIYQKYKELEGDIVSAEVYQTWSKETLLLDDDKTELHLLKSASIPGDFFRKGDMVRVVIEEVKNENNNPRIIVSRTSDQFLRRLFELEVPEIHDGLINIRAVSRIPGERAKIAVESYDDRIDPVGACVGVKGSRIHGIVRELHNENIDVLTWTNKPNLLITRALAPAKVSTVLVDEENRTAEVFVRPEEVQYAIGKGGTNIKTASMITGYEIEVYRDEGDDIHLNEFRDEIEDWVIDALRNIGCVTARAVLNMTPAEVAEKADLEDETVEEIFRILQAEFEDAGNDDASADEAADAAEDAEESTAEEAMADEASEEEPEEEKPTEE